MAASLGHVEIRQVRNDYTFRFEGKLYQIGRSAIVSGMRGGNVRIEKRLDGAIAVRYSELYLAVEECTVAVKRRTPLPDPAQARRTGQRGRTGIRTLICIRPRRSGRRQSEPSLRARLAFFQACGI
jgi:hypothetical protein